MTCWEDLNVLSSISSPVQIILLWGRMEVFDEPIRWVATWYFRREANAKEWLTGD
jgi:hypothetical protein